MPNTAESVPELSSTERAGIAAGNAAIQILSEFGIAEKVGRYWIARLDVDGFVLASVIGPQKPNAMPETVNVKVANGGDILLDIEWGEDHCDLITFLPGDWQNRIGNLGEAMQRSSTQGQA